MNLQPRLIYCDPFLAAFDKPSGLLSQPGLGAELADSLLSRVQIHRPQLRLVHRLDRDTSGLLLLAFSAEMHRQLSDLFAQRRIRKAYLAEVVGHPPALGGRIDTPLARLSSRPPRYGAVAVADGGKPALSHWRVLQRSFDGQGRPIARLLLAPRTGRSHQLRVHLAQIGHPLRGDGLYGSSADVDRLRLHACGLRFWHPATGVPLRLRCPPPWGHLEGASAPRHAHG